MARHDPDQEPHELAFGPPRAAVPALLAVAALIAVAAWNSDAAGRIGGAMAVVALVAGAGWITRGPVLVANRAEVTVRTLFHRQAVAWADVIAIHAVDRGRGRAVEIETDDALFGVSAALLGRTTVGEAAEALRTYWQEEQSTHADPAG